MIAMHCIASGFIKALVWCNSIETWDGHTADIYSICNTARPGIFTVDVQSVCTRGEYMHSSLEKDDTLREANIYF